MPGLLTVKIESFFDRPEILRQIDRYERRWLLRMGAFVRRAARQSIRKRKRISRPGEPPSSHTGILKNSIFFGLSDNVSVVIGPSARFRQRDSRGNRRGASLLEFGGTVRRGNEVLRYQPRPFMGPALESGLSDLEDRYPVELPRMWKRAQISGGG